MRCLHHTPAGLFPDVAKQASKTANIVEAKAETKRRYERIEADHLKFT
jgi:hypothetical protein